jgi:ATP-dependent DNA helicase RecG
MDRTQIGLGLSREDLNRVLADLRELGIDHQTVEAKRAERALPTTIWETLSAFATAIGGLILLGVDEETGFAVTGIADPARLMAALQSACAEMEPPLRAQIEVIPHESGSVIVAQIPAVPRDQRPCYREGRGPYDGSFVRVGDADQKLERPEVDDMLSGRSGEDHSRRPALAEALLDPATASVFASSVRATSDRYADQSDEAILRAWNVLLDSGLSVAGFLTLGNSPQNLSSLARIAYRRLPRAGANPDTRFTGDHLEGTLGQLLEDALARLGKDLVAQVVRNGDVFDETDVPREALREVVANALLHRSLSIARDGEMAAIEVSDEAVVVTSPGGLHAAADPALLGLDVISTVRNHSLVRIGEHIRTPTGARLLENQASGIAAADRACHAVRTMPALFVDLPSRFQVSLLRGTLDDTGARERLLGAGLPESDDYVRVLSVAERLERIRSESAGSPLRWMVMDARLAARALAPSAIEDAAVVLRTLEDKGIFRRSHLRHTPSWFLVDAQTPSTSGGAIQSPDIPRGKRGDRIPALVAAIAESEERALSPKAIGEKLGLSSSKSVHAWINRAAEAELIEPTRENQFDPNQTYRLTQRGEGVVRSLVGGS